MYKVLVVDDEQIVLDAMSYIIEKRQDDVKLCGTASSGRAAIEQVKVHHPDIVFIDIRMPGLSGIDAIEAIQSFAPLTKCVIISAYEQFEYAKQAVRLSVKDYLLKPINRSKVNQLIDHLVLQINDERAQRQREIETIEKLRQMMPHIETAFVYSILSNRNQSEEPRAYLSLLGLEASFGCIVTMTLKSKKEPQQVLKTINDFDASIIKQEEYQHVRDIIKHTCPAVVGPLMAHKVVFFLPMPANGNDYNARVKTLEYAESIASHIDAKLKRGCAIGLSNSHPIQDLHYAYHESLKALGEIEIEGVCHVADLYGENTEILETAKIKAQLLQMIELGKPDHALEYLERLFPIISNHQESILELIVLVYRVASDAAMPEDDVMHYQKDLKDAMAMGESDALFAWLATRIKHVATRIHMFKENKCSHVVERTKHHLEELFTSEVTLEGVARNLNISPQYLSKIFKEQTGVTFIDYLTDLRMEEAKHLLNEGVYSVKEICFKVGYTDPNYFSRVFRKRTGFNPTDYSRKSGSLENLTPLVEVDR